MRCSDGSRRVTIHLHYSMIVGRVVEGGDISSSPDQYRIAEREKKYRYFTIEE